MQSIVAEGGSSVMYKITAYSESGQATVTMNSEHLMIETVLRLVNTVGIVSLKVEPEGVATLAEAV